MTYIRLTLAFVLVVMALSACANLGSISRRTTLPPFNSFIGSYEGTGQAIHLDVKQRLVVTNSEGHICAEPSPDALAVYASGLSGSVSVPAKGAGTAAGSFQESAASIGLRTQSITLMRDALYRLCEAYYNRQLSQAQVMLLLSRSQDLTAAIVAVEQLTGAVVAQQAALSSAAGASGAAALVSNTKALEQMQTLQKKKADELAEVQKKQGEARAARDSKRQEVDAKQEEITSTPGDDTETRERLTKQRDALEKQLPALERKLELEDSNVALLKKQLDDVTRVTNEIASQLDSALTSGSTTAAGTSVLGTLSSRGGLNPSDAASIESVTRGVKEIVTTVLGKQYIVETCTTLLTNPIPANIIDRTEYNKTIRECYEVIRNAAQAQSETFQQKISSFGKDTSTDRLVNAMQVDPTFRRRLQNWVERNYPEGSVTRLLYGQENAQLRQRAIQELNAP